MCKTRVLQELLFNRTSSSLRPYVVETNGTSIRRNRCDLIPTTGPLPTTVEDDEVNLEVRTQTNLLLREKLQARKKLSACSKL